MSIRPTFEEIFIQTAILWSKRSTCLRRHIGAVAVKDNRIIATGYNGQVAGSPHCITCIREEMDIPSGQRHELCKVIHAEQNILVQCALHGISIKNADIYITNRPCSICFKLLANSQVRAIYYKDYYPDELVDVLMEECNAFHSFEDNLNKITFYKEIL